MTTQKSLLMSLMERFLVKRLKMYKDRVNKYILSSCTLVHNLAYFYETVA